MTVTNWRQIDTTTYDGLKALRLAVIEAIGWRDVEEIEYWSDDFHGASKIHSFGGIYPNETDAYGREIPDYPYDLNACVQELKTIFDNSESVKDIFWEIREGQARILKFNYADAYHPEELVATEGHSSEAVAVCIVILKWREGDIRS